MKRFAFLLSAEEYMFYSPTPFCHRDNDLIRNSLIELCGYAEQDITSLKLDVFNEMKPNEVLEKLTELAERTETGDTLVFYFAGHGMVEESDSYLVLPHTQPDNIIQTALPLRDISSILRKPGILNLRIYDACHSGQDVRSVPIAIPNSNEFTQNIFLDSKSEGYITIASCMEDEYSYPDVNLEHGIFTYYLHEALKEFKEGEEILPELLKIRLCEKVEIWCKENGKIQTPTINASISGNISIGTRNKIEVLQENNIEDNKEEDFLSLLSDIRSSHTFDNIKHHQLLEEYVKYIYSSLEQNITNINSYGLEVNLKEPTSIDYVDSKVKKSIVKYLNKKRYKPLHKITFREIYETEREKSYLDRLEGLSYARPKPQLIEVIYDIKQPFDCPNCYIELNITSDKVVPHVKIFIYLLPLQINTCFIGGLHLDYEDEEIKEVCIERVIKHDDNNDILDSLIDELVSIYNTKSREFIAKRVKYLKWELQQ